MAEPILCVKCKRPVRAEAEFCNACGQRLKKRCVSTACDAVLSFADTHCFKCGTPQGGTSSIGAVIGRIDAEKAIKAGQGVGGCLLAPFKFLIQTFIGAGPIGWIALVLLPIGLVVCSVINNLTRGLAGQILIIWPLQMLGGSIIGACLPVVFLFGLIGLTFIAIRKKWFQRAIVWAEAKGREDRPQYLAAQARKHEEAERKRVAEEARRRRQEAARRTRPRRQPGLSERLASWRPGRRALPPTPVQPAPPPQPPETLTPIAPPPPVLMPAGKECPTCGASNRLTTKKCKNCGTNLYATRKVAPAAAPVQPVPPAVVQGFSKEIIDAQVRRVALRVSSRIWAELIVRQAIAELAGGQDFSAAALKKAVDDVLLRQA